MRDPGNEVVIAVYAKRDRRNLAREGMILKRGRGILIGFHRHVILLSNQQ